MPNILLPRSYGPPTTTSGTLTAGKHSTLDATGGPLSMSLPVPPDVDTYLSVEKVDPSANPVTIAGSIRGGGGSVTLTVQYQTAELRWNGSTWRVTAGYGAPSAGSGGSGGGLGGVTVTGTPTSGQTIVASSPTDAAWQAPTGGDYFTSSYLTVGEATVPRMLVNSGGITLTSGSVRLGYFTARLTQTVTRVRVLSSGTAAGATPTLVKVGVYTVDGSGNLTLAGASTSDPTLFAAASTTYTATLSSTTTITAGSRYAIGVLVVTAAAAPTIYGVNALLAAEMAVAPRLAGSVSGQTDLPATVTAAGIGSSGSMPYAVLLP